MKIEKIILKNFQSFKESDAELSGMNVISIVGKYKGEERRSNGSGKSTVLDAISYSLYGKSRTKREDDLIRENQDNMEVEVFIELNKNEKMRIVRGKSKNKGYLNLFINDIDKTSGKIETQKIIEDKIGMDFDLFTATVFFQQHESDQFSGSTPTERKNYLKKLLNLSIYDKAYRKNSEEMKKIDEEMSKIKGTIDYLKDQVEKINIEDISNQLLVLKKEYDESIGFIKKLNIKKEKIQKENQERVQVYEKYKETKESVEEIIDEIEDIDNDIDSYDSSLKESEGALKIIKISLATYSEIDENQLEKIKLSGEENKIKIGKLESCIDNNKKEINKLNKQKEDIANEAICSRCNTKLSFEKKKEFSDEKDKEISKLILENDKALVEIKSIEKVLECDREKYKKLKNQLNQKASLKIEEKSKQTEIKSVKENIKQLKTSLEKYIDKLSKSEEKLKQLETKLKDFGENNNYEKTINDLKRQIEDNENDKNLLLGKIKEHESLINNYESQKKSYKNKKSKYKKLKWEYNCLNILKNAFGKNGVSSDVIKESLEEISREANLILKEINNGEYKIVFETIKENKDKSVSDSLDIYVENNRALRLYESYSGGQKSIINFSIRMALSKILSKLNNVAFGMVCLDEVFGQLDNFNKDKMIDVINYLKPTFFQILVISHSDLKESFENNLVIEFNKKNGISEFKGFV